MRCIFNTALDVRDMGIKIEHIFIDNRQCGSKVLGLIF